jgi:CubicO group peptidase (beta-lactamase class C family)
VLNALLFDAFCQAAQDQSSPQDLPVVSPEAAGMSAKRLAVIDDVLNQGLDRGNMPGAVVLVAHQAQVVYHKAFGFRQVEPEKVPMTPDTVFDLASLTKPVATATSVMSLVEQGKIELQKPVAAYIPEFAVNGKESITVEQLLTHMSGLIPDNHMRDYQDGVEESFRRIHELKPTSEPGSKFKYSDVGFLVLGELVERVSGKNVHQYSHEWLYAPLGMTETGYLPAEDLRSRAAVTQQREGRWMQGEVHDPRAYALQGIAGHAGLFSTATDLAKFGQMLINGGRLGDVRVLKQQTVELMRAPYQVSSGLRTRGWDMKSAYSSNRGDLMSDSAFGHGGFTGTAMWVDPDQQLIVVFLSNRVHPDGKGSVNTLAGRIGTIAAAAIIE